ncbi:hypothetical protein KPH14_002740 [Odynerus spinipes]|uniref:Carboxylic ester hydrolase n=1 Tax=Odynerus spinipes TaxID=1348599 RepID=A0AAD9VQ76_9HYME|nr:hypothetical protein KPH14_002740 [Odynerus spinipes]
MAQTTPFILLVLLELWIGVSCAIKFAPVIETTKGPVRGSVLKTVKQSQEYFSYRNIRYAKPPVGYLRFKPPVEVDPWTEVLNATEDGPVCPQLKDDDVIGDEDCLNLNVYTPKIPDENGSDELKPVMFWIYGGAFSSGYNKKSTYSPDYLIEEGVVFVSVNYRLGPLGFLALGHPNATGNAALKDQNLAMQWVQDNIAKFGGDPKMVTIFGQSAGAASVDLHVLSKKSRGLFHRAIAMSGSSITVWGFHKPQEARKRGFQLAEILGCKTDDVESLLQFYYKADVKSLITATTNITLVDLPFKPTSEDSSLGSDLFLTECPIKIYKSGRFSQVPYMLGYMKDEALVATKTAKDFRDHFIYTLEHMSNLGIGRISLDTLNPIMNMNNNMVDVSPFTDILFIAPIDYTQKLLLKSKSPVYYYRYSYDYDKSLHKIVSDVHINGSAHGDEIPMIFYSDSFQIDPNSNDTRELVQRRVTRLWTNFAKYGNPTPEGTKDELLNVVWPDSKPNGEMLEISDKLEARKRYTSARIEVIELAIRASIEKYTGCSSDA